MIQIWNFLFVTFKMSMKKRFCAYKMNFISDDFSIIFINKSFKLKYLIAEWQLYQFRVM